MAGFFLRLDGRVPSGRRLVFLDARGASVNEWTDLMECKDTMVPSARPFPRYCYAAAGAMVAGAFCRPVPVPAQNEAGDGGEKIFTQNNCFVCHGQQGFGGVGLAFRNDPFLRLNDYVVGQILMGRGVMPPFGGKLDDKEVAAVANYIGNSWGNHFGTIQPGQVAQLRRELEAAGQQEVSPSETTGSAGPPGTR